MKKINVAILFGGKSAEHEVSLKSAKNVIDAIDRKKYNPILIKIGKNGKWTLNKDKVALIPSSKGEIINLSKPGNKQCADVVFPILHGPFGEDGTVQGLLKLADVPFVGAGVLGSAVGMDKDAMKRILRDAGVPIADFLVFKGADKIDFNKIVEKIGLPFFIKPANLGSSVGINKVSGKKDFAKAVAEAFKYDVKILAEEYVKGREIECAVLGNDNPIASVPGEIRVKREFYSYDAKYIDSEGAVLEIPAELDKKTKNKIQDLAVKTFEALYCEGLGRVDFFLKENGEIIVNEINTIPGFTSSSMYPKLWEASGIGYADLIDKLIQLAIERFKKSRKIKISR
ncbi:MAG: D-alanine--D-alanine ligase family protein [bacterium]